jgi:hypothetical protein
MRSLALVCLTFVTMTDEKPVSLRFYVRLQV